MPSVFFVLLLISMICSLVVCLRNDVFLVYIHTQCNKIHVLSRITSCHSKNVTRLDISNRDNLLLSYLCLSVGTVLFQVVVPPLPGKALIRQLPFRGDDGIFDDSFIEERRQGLEQFLNKWAFSHHLRLGLSFSYFAVGSKQFVLYSLSPIHCCLSVVLFSLSGNNETLCAIK